MNNSVCVVTPPKKTTFIRITILDHNIATENFYFCVYKNKSSTVLSRAAVKEFCSHKILSLAPVANYTHEWTNLLFLNVNVVLTYECGVLLLHSRRVSVIVNGPRVDRGDIISSENQA